VHHSLNSRLVNFWRYGKSFLNNDHQSDMGSAVHSIFEQSVD
jgi:hypothetical protein